MSFPKSTKTMWRSESVGGWIHIENMNTGHLINCVKKLRRMAPAEIKDMGLNIHKEDGQLFFEVENFLHEQVPGYMMMLNVLMKRGYNVRTLEKREEPTLGPTGPALRDKLDQLEKLLNHAANYGMNLNLRRPVGSQPPLQKLENLVQSVARLWEKLDSERNLRESETRALAETVAALTNEATGRMHEIRSLQSGQSKLFASIDEIRKKADKKDAARSRKKS